MTILAKEGERFAGKELRLLLRHVMATAFHHKAARVLCGGLKAVVGRVTLTARSADAENGYAKLAAGELPVVGSVLVEAAVVAHAEAAGGGVAADINVQVGFTEDARLVDVAIEEGG